jgi:hypothetical protein
MNGRAWTRTRRGAAVAAALLALAPARAYAASCCGGGGGAAPLAARGEAALLDLTMAAERYDGYWDLDGVHKPDPPGSSLAQYRLLASGALRIGERWQVTGALPVVFNDNRYGGISSRTRGLGDAVLGLFWETLDQQSAWRLASAADLVPALTVGATLTVPTGISPYDDVTSSFDVTGRGFYRLDALVNVDKGYRAWSLSLSAAFGIGFQRWVNRSYGGWVPPVQKRLGQRASVGGTVAYRHFLGTGGQALALGAGLAWAHEDQGTRDGVRDETTGFGQTTASLTVSWSSTDSDWSARAGLAHAIQADGWGRNFPTTDTVTLGVRRAFR